MGKIQTRKNYCNEYCNNWEISATSVDFVKVSMELGSGCGRSDPSCTHCTHTERIVRAKTGTATRVHARACRATRFQPLRNKSSEENLPEGINVGVGSPRRVVSLLASRRGLSCTPAGPYRASLKRRVLPRDLLVWIYSTDDRSCSPSDQSGLDG